MSIEVDRVGRERIRDSISFPENEGRTLQSEADATDINQIMLRFERGEVLEHVNEHQGNYGDFTAAVDYHTALNTARRAEEMFMTLPARIRGHFKNDPGDLLAASADPDRLEEMQELGLLSPRRAASDASKEASPAPEPTSPDAGATPLETPPPAAS